MGEKSSCFFQYYEEHTDEYSVDGITLSAGEVHIWTFASGFFNGTSSQPNDTSRCPCDPGNSQAPPPFVGEDYFCESPATFETRDDSKLYTDNALWDGHGCEGTVNQCCRHNNPPWFHKILTVPTCDDISLKVYLRDQEPDIAIELVEIYVH